MGGSAQSTFGGIDPRERSALLRAGAPQPLLPRSAEARLGQRQQEVLDQLEELFLDRGFAQLTITDLASGVGCSRRTLYELAPSKDQLVLLVIDRLLHKRGRSALRAVDVSAPLESQIRAYLAGGIGVSWEGRFTDDLADDAAARRLVDHHFRFVMTVVQRLISLGIETGEFRPVNPAIVAATITGAALYIDEPNISDALGLKTADALRQILDLVLPSLTREPALTTEHVRTPMTTPTTTPSPTAASVRDDLLAEQAALDAIVADIPAAEWALDTPSARWTVADQIAHLAHFDETATWAITDEKRFKESVNELMGALTGDASDEDVDALTLRRFRAMTPSELLAVWRENRRALAVASATLDDDTRVIWYGPSMGAKSFLTARLMECWAHGQHVCDALGVEREATDRLAHIAQLGFITRKWTYVNRGLDAPSTPVRVELTAPSGGVWAFGPHDAEESVVGSAEDFCLVVTQCRNVAATDLEVTGAAATEWMAMAQAFAGAATDGPAA